VASPTSLRIPGPLGPSNVAKQSSPSCLLVQYLRSTEKMNLLNLILVVLFVLTRNGQSEDDEDYEGEIASTPGVVHSLESSDDLVSLSKKYGKLIVFFGASWCGYW
jgi:hypothetical protein